MKRNRKKTWIKVLILIVALVLVGLALTFYLGFYGNPFMKMMAKTELSKYLTTNYPNRPDLVMEEITYNFKDGRYHSKVQSTTSDDTYFFISSKKGTPVQDDYEYRVPNGQNTLVRLYDEAGQMIAQELSSLGEMKVWVRAEKLEEPPYFPLDIPYEKGMIEINYITIEQQSEEHSAEIVADFVPKAFQLLEQAGYAVEFMDYQLVKSDFKQNYNVYSITPEDAFAENFLSRLQELERLFKADPSSVYAKEDLRVIMND